MAAWESDSPRTQASAPRRASAAKNSRIELRNRRRSACSCGSGPVEWDFSWFQVHVAPCINWCFRPEQNVCPFARVSDSQAATAADQQLGKSWGAGCHKARRGACRGVRGCRCVPAGFLTTARWWWARALQWTFRYSSLLFFNSRCTETGHCFGPTFRTPRFAAFAQPCALTADCTESL